MFGFVLVAIIATAAHAEQVPCKTGQSYCTGLASLSIVDNNFFCCDTGLNMQWTTEKSNETSISKCVCNRHFYESDCIEGHVQCLDAHSLMSDGVTTKCCKNGDSMNSVSNSFVNGVKVDYCKCIRYVNNGVQTGVVNVGGMLRSMKNAEHDQFTSYMAELTKTLEAGMNQLSQTLGQNLGLLDFNIGQQTARQNRPGGVRNLVSSFLERFGRDFGKRLDQTDTSNIETSNATSTSSAGANTSPLARPNSLWDRRQRRLQQFQRRLQTLQGKEAPIVDRFDRNLAFSSVANPRYWFGRALRGALGPNPALGSNASRDVIAGSNNAGNVAPINRYNSATASNLTAFTA